MITRIPRIAILTTALLSTSAMAVTPTGDIEIYVGSNNAASEVLPNVLFIVDTSGSMKEEVPNSSGYDANKTYTGGGYDNDKVYVSSSGLPATTDWFYASVNYCKAAQEKLATDGSFSDKYVMYSGSTWSVPKSLSSKTRSYPLECSSDYSTHGKIAGDGKPYPTSYTATGWSSSKTGSTIDFNKGIGDRTLYSGNYLNYLKNNGLSGNRTRLQVVKDTLESLLKDASGINAAIMRFDNADSFTYGDYEGARGGYPVTPMLRLDKDAADYATNKQTLIDAVKALNNPSNTPTAETLYEAGLYFQGLAPKFATGNTQNVIPSGVISGGKYISPIKYQCQRNFIVFLSDGDPTYDDDADDLIKSQPDFFKHSSACSFQYTGSKLYATADCAEEQALYLNKKDLSPTLPDTQSLTIFTIGFSEGMSAFGQALMNNVAKNGGGFYRPSTTVADITTAFNDILTTIKSTNTSFTAPAVSVNAFNRLTYLDEIYYAVFRPSVYPKWDGNVKRYRLARPDTESSLALLDAKDAKAIDDVTGFFKSTSTSYWSDVIDGEDVALGGAAGELGLTRKVYTCCFGGAKNLTNSANALHESNATYLTSTVLGTATETERTAVLQWARGVDVTDSDGDGDSTDARTQMGDPLHTEPVLITYGKTVTGSPEMALYASTNEGFLHAIDTATGEELFSWIPSDLLSNLKPLKLGDTANSHLFGLDGPISAWVYDKNYDGTIDPVTDHVYLYVTQRRGGNHIYALDVTSRTSPSLMWTITGGTGGFAELGETWSKPILARVKFNGEARMVLFFGGGYDEAQTGASVLTPDSIGRAIFMIDASTGALLWHASPESTADLRLTEMTNSIPSEARVIDVDGDGYSDRIYVGDMGGRLWRIDLNNANTGASNFATGGVLAKISDNTQEGNRRFYYPPSVSMSARGEYINLAIGSGFREHPLDRVIQDRFWVFRDPNVDHPQMTGGNPVYNLLTDFVDATTWLNAGDVNQSALAASDGFYIKLLTDGTWQGEKVLAQAATMGGYVIFTTYTPVAAAQADVCAPTEGMAREYVMSVEDGTVMPGSNERYTILTHGGIPPRPVIITVPDGSAVLIGTNVMDATGLKPKFSKTNWRRN